MIVAPDQLVWRPLVAWAARFKLEETTTEGEPRSWVLGLLGRSAMLHRLGARLAPRPVSAGRASSGPGWWRPAVRLAGGAGLLLLLVAALASAWALARLVLAVPAAGWGRIASALLETTLRTTGAVVLAAAWALPVGIWIGRSPRLAHRLEPLVQILASFPAPMLYPLVTTVLLAPDVPFSLVAVALMLLGAHAMALTAIRLPAESPHDAVRVILDWGRASGVLAFDPVGQEIPRPS